MVWKKLVEEYQYITSWLEQAGYSEVELIIIKVFALIIRQKSQPEEILGLAVLPVLPHELLNNLSAVPETREFPDSVMRSVQHLTALLAGETVLLGEIYEHTARKRRVNGVYYTPKQVISFILKQTVMELDIVAEPMVKVLDPACGSGYFLLAAYDILFNKFVKHRAELKTVFPAEDWSDDGIHRHILKYNLWGADIDTAAAEITKVALLLKRKGVSALCPNIIVYDSLQRTENDQSVLKAVRAFWAPGYDYVIGNPPYLSFGLRGAATIDTEYKKYLRQNYSASAEYKLSYYVLFMQRGIELLAEGGRLGFIIPDSFLLGRYYSKIRKFILDNTSIECIAHIAAAVFKGAATGYSAICILRKEKNQARRDTNEIKVCQVNRIDTLESGSFSATCRQSYFATLPYQRFRVFFAARTKKIVDYIDSVSVPLSNFASGHTGIRSLSKQSDIIAAECQGSSWQKGLISGSQIDRYSLEYKGHYINIHPAVLYKGGWRQEIIAQRKILLRQTGDSLTACIDDHGYYHLNNIHSFILQEKADSSEISLDYLLLILNSRLISFYYHAVSMEYGRPMAQTDIETLELMPIRVQREINKQAYSLVQTMESCVRQGRADAAAKNKAAGFDEYINQIVYRIYGLSDEDISYIEQYEHNLKVNGRYRKTGLKEN
ncbi:MAG: N-6 DNA methylase [Pelosinus sp.]|nr:N-6 DNA methylase [Pelosinus sp.]